MSEENNNENTENSNEKEENKINNNDEGNNDNGTKQNYNLPLCIIAVIAIFLGTFTAVYTIIDMNMYKLGFYPFTETFKQIDKIFDEDSKFLERSLPIPVKIEEKDNKYIVTVNLKNFDNNPENVQIETKNNGIKITGGIKKDKEGEIKENSFYQNVIFPKEIDEKSITKENKQNKVIITLPEKK